MDRDTSRHVSDMNYLTKQFLCCASISKIDFTERERVLGDFEADSFNLHVQKQILDNTINSTLVTRYPMKTSYQRAFLKLFMQKIKDSGNEIHDDLYIAYCRLVSSPNEESIHYRHFLIENGTLDCITLKESTNLISEGTTGLCSWQGAVVLSEWCIENIPQFHKKTVLELGCGVGLTGMSIISVCSPNQYLFSDCHQTVLDMLCENVKLNFLANKQCQSLDTRHKTSRLKLQLKYEQTDIHIIELKWDDIDKYIIEGFSQPDIIIAADILYESALFTSLIAGLKYLLTSNNYAVLAATIRNEDTISQFLEQLGDHSLAFKDYIPPNRTISVQSIDSPVRILKVFQKILH